MNCRIGMNVVLVLEVVKLRRKVVAADTGAAKSSYSSWQKVRFFPPVLT